MNQHTDEPRFATVTAEGVDYQIYLTSPDRDYIQKNLATKGVPYELAMLTDMKSRLTADSTVLDVGANIGNHTFYLAQVPRCQVIAFEANDELAHAMDITASEAGLEERVTVHAFALGEKPGFAEFEQPMPDNLGGQSLRKGSGKIKVRTLDSFGIAGPVAAIKIDVEGMELDVLKGGKKLIEKNLPILYVESQTKESFADISSYLGTLGYCYRNTFNATPTHLFIHKTKLKNEAGVALSALHRVEHEYDLLAANKKVKKDLVDCQMKYREVCQLNSHLKSENEQLRQQEQANKADADQADIVKLQAEQDQAKQALAEANRQIDRLRDEVARERSEKDFQAQQYSQQNLAGRLDAALQEKLTAEVERLTAESRSQKALLEGQQALKFALEDSKKKCAEMAFILENTKSEVAQVQAERGKLAAALKERESESAQLLSLNEQLADMQKQRQLLQAELEKQQAQLASQDKASKDQVLRLQSQAEQLAVAEKQQAELDAVKAKLQQLTADNARLQAEKAQLSSAVEEARNEAAKAEDLAQVLLDCQSQLTRSQAENAKLLAQVEDLDKVLTSTQGDALKIKELEQKLAAHAAQSERAAGELAQLASELEATRKDAAKVPELMAEIARLEQQHGNHDDLVASLQAEHEQYIQGLRAIYEQQQRDNEQQMQIMIQKKIESLAPLQANQEKLDKLVEYRNDIEKIYSERTPLLSDLQGSQGIAQIEEKKAALEALNQQLAEFNNSRQSP